MHDGPRHRDGRSSIEQRLLVRALERAAARLDMTPLVGRVVRIELFTLTKDQTFAREFLGHASNSAASARRPEGMLT